MKKKILLISEYFPASDKVEITGGIETRAYAFAKELAKTYDVTVMCSREKGLPKSAEFSGFKVIRCGFQRKYIQSGSIISRFSFIFGAFFAGLRLRPDLVDGYNYISYIPALWIGQILRIPRVATYHDVWVGEWTKHIGFIPGLICEVMERYILLFKGRMWTHFITNSQTTKDKLVKYGVNDSKITPIYSGVFLKDYEKRSVKKFKNPTITFIGRLVPYKRVDDLLNAIAKVKDKIPNINCIIIGDGPERGKLEALSKYLSLTKSVSFTGYLNHAQAMEMMRKCHVFSLPSAVEGMGLVTIEAMACGVPYVNSDIPPTREITKNGKGGLLFSVGDIDNLATNITKMIKDASLRSKCIYEHKQLVSQFDWNHLADLVKDLYQALLNK